MTQDDIKKLAIEASDIKAETWSGGMDMTWDEIERFAELVAAVEREACAALCFQIWNKWMDEKDTTPFPDAEDCAAAIRARGQHD
jgi:hypothetical protein